MYLIDITFEQIRLRKLILDWDQLLVYATGIVQNIEIKHKITYSVWSKNQQFFINFIYGNHLLPYSVRLVM